MGSSSNPGEEFEALRSRLCSWLLSHYGAQCRKHRYSPEDLLQEGLIGAWSALCQPPRYRSRFRTACWGARTGAWRFLQREWAYRRLRSDFRRVRQAEMEADAGPHRLHTMSELVGREGLPSRVEAAFEGVTPDFVPALLNRLEEQEKGKATEQSVRLSRAGQPRWSEGWVAAIRQEYATGPLGLRALAQKFGIAMNTADDIVHQRGAYSDR